jgi:uncharacterized membrane-anchored protein YhcB (DUF1043 family)
MIGRAQSGWQNPRILLALGLVFLCGAVSGAVVARLTSQQVSAKMNATWRENGKEVTLRHFVKELSLSPGQTAEIETVLDDFSMYYQMLQSQMDEVRASGKSRIEQVLNPEQRQRFDKMMNELKDKQIR